MYLALNTDEQEIANAAADFLSNEFPLQRLHAVPQDPCQLKAFAELGWLGLAAPESVGGINLTVIEEMLFFLELGRVIGPVNVLTQTIAVAVAQQDEALCRKFVAGEQEVALLVVQQDGSIRLVGNARAAYAVAIDADNAVLYALDGSHCQAVPCLDRSVAMFTGSSSALRSLISIKSGALWKKILIDISAMLIGLAESALDMIVEYAKQRQTFGRAIGSYQAVRHPCADMAVRVEGARSQLFYAATALKEQHDNVDQEISAAVLLAERAARANVDANIQLHGGIGVTDEHDAHLLMKRANLLCRLLGSGKSLRADLLTVAEKSER